MRSRISQHSIVFPHKLVLATHTLQEQTDINSQEKILPRWKISVASIDVLIRRLKSQKPLTALNDHDALRSPDPDARNNAMLFIGHTKLFVDISRLDDDHAGNSAIDLLLVVRGLTNVLKQLDDMNLSMVKTGTPLLVAIFLSMSKAIWTIVTGIMIWNSGVSGASTNEGDR